MAAMIWRASSRSQLIEDKAGQDEANGAHRSFNLISRS